MKVALLILGATLLLQHYADGVAVMSVDFGSEWMKIGIVSPGVPMEIALNKESKRKSPAVISYRNGVRSFGEEAQTVGIRFPKNAYFYLLELLGKSIDHPLVQLYQKRFPYHEIIADEERGTILFRHDEGTVYRPEELVAQLLHRAKEFAEQSAHQPITECVITVPGYFNQVERKAVLQAAQLADIKVLQLINDYMAVALNYGIFRTKDFNETAQYVMFYDMGASSTTATIVGMQNVKTKERGYVETHPQISVIGVGYDRTLGGLEFQVRLRDFLARKFNEMKKTPNDVFKNPRSMAKLFKEAGRLKNVLSANNGHYAQIEGLLDEQDFRVQVSREEFESLCEDLFERVAYPVEQALKSAGLTVDIINQVVLVGAGTRVPKVQEKLQAIVKTDLAKNVNTDEAATMGAVYKAADLSTGFQVKKFITKDVVLFPIQVAFERETDDNTKQMKRTLFGLMNHYPQKKIITFNKHTDDFSINLNYADLDYLSTSEILNIGGQNLTKIDLKGVAEALEKHKADNVESKGIKAHFNMDESGILALTNVELVFEKTVKPDEEDEGTLSRLGSTITKLFSGAEEKPVHEEVEIPPPTTTEQPPKAKDGEEDGKTNKSESADSNKTVTDPPKDVKPKIVVVKEPLKAFEKVLSIEQLTKTQLEASSEKIHKLNEIDRELNRRAGALNNLESFVIDVQTKLDENEYASASTTEEINSIRASCAEVSDWLYEDGAEADAATYESRLEQLKSLTFDLFWRVKEHRDRPEALSALKDMLNGSTSFLNSARNLTKTKNPDKDVFTDAEIEALDKLISETEQWRDKKLEEQKKLKKYEQPKLTIKALSERMQAIDREMKYLVNKIKMWKPKKVEKPIVESKNDTKPADKPAEEEREGSATDGVTPETIEVEKDGSGGDQHVEL